MTTPVDLFKLLARTTVEHLPIIVMNPSNSTSPYAPSPPLPAATIRYVHLRSNPDLPQMLYNSLEAFLSGLGIQDLNMEELTHASRYIPHVLHESRRQTLSNEDSVHDSFRETVFKTVQVICAVMNTDVQYDKGPRFPNVGPGKALKVNGETIAILEHKSPAVAARHFPEIVTLGINQERLDLRDRTTNAHSILSKLALTLLSAQLEYGVLHSAESYIFLRIVRDNNQAWHLMISDILRLTDRDTPIIPLIVSLILHARRDGQALPSLSFEIPTVITNDTQASNATGDSTSGIPDNGLAHYATQDEGEAALEGTSSSDTAHTLRSFGYYWVPKKMNESALATLLGTLGRIPLCWKLYPYSTDIWQPTRQTGSLVWGELAADNSNNQIIDRLLPSEQYTSPPSQPLHPFGLQLDSNAGHGAKGWAFRGCITGLPDIRLVAKFVSVDQMSEELAIWRRLRPIAGIKVPGLYGAYVFEDGSQNGQRGLLLQQDAGQSLITYGSLDLQQRWELFCAALSIHSAGVVHRDIRPPNVAVAEDGHVMIIDFDQAEDHECPGEMYCGELRYLKSQLGLPPVREQPKPNNDRFKGSLTQEGGMERPADA